MERIIRRIPFNGTGVDVDLRGYKDILQHPYFTRLERVQQVPLATRYIGCRHTRLEHSLGTYWVTSRLLERRTRKALFEDEEERSIKIAALLHDIGHGPYSHVIENISEIDHNMMTISITEEMEKEIKSAGGNLDTVKNVMKKQHELYPLVKSILGADCLDYIPRDLYHCGLGSVPSLERLITSVVFEGENDNRYGVLYSNDGGDAVINFIKSWWDAHRNIYLHKDTEIPRTMFQRAVKMVFGTVGEDVFGMDDTELLSRLYESEDKNVQRLMSRIRNREFYQEIAVLKLDGYEMFEDRKTSVYTATKEEMRRLHTDGIAEDAERRIEKEFNLPEQSVIIANSQDIERINPKDNVSRDKSAHILIGDSLKPVEEVYPDFFEYMGEETRRHFAIRVTVDPELIRKFEDKAKGVNLKKFLI